MLNIENLTISAGGKSIINDVSLSVNAGEILGLVGESGCGKSVTALSIMGLLSPVLMQVHQGVVAFRDNDLLTLSAKELCRIRGNDIAMIFQEPMTSLNPLFSVGDQITEALYLHNRVSRLQRHSDGRKRAAQLLDRVGFASPELVLSRYPHQLSGGQRQRVMIAMALACEPALLIADEPTTALDVTVQAQILELISTLCAEQGLGVLLITHDLGVVQQYCERVAVMYCGQIVEQGSCMEVFAQPWHRYTQALLTTIPAANAPGTRLPAIHGSVPEPGNYPEGCRFAPRCMATVERCHTDAPVLTQAGHAVRCWNPVT
ncbi:MAG: ABC transporter ATP-binding protein [Granulosicoccus sp.]